MSPVASLFDAVTGGAQISIETSNSVSLQYDLSFIVPDWENSAGALVKKLEEETEKRYYTDKVRFRVFLRVLFDNPAG